MKRISFFALALAAGISVSAQNNEPQLRTPMAITPRFGIKAGINSARLEVKNSASDGAQPNTNPKTSLHAGVFFNLPIAGAFRVQPELLYNIQGSKTSAISSSNPNLAGITEIDLHYFTLPVMLQVATPKGFMIEAGPQLSYLSSANGDRTNANSDVNLKDLKYVKKTDFAVAGGVGYLSRIGLGISARYVYGFTNIWDNEDASAGVQNLDWRNRNLQIGLTYHFGASK